MIFFFLLLIIENKFFFRMLFDCFLHLFFYGYVKND